MDKKKIAIFITLIILIISQSLMLYGGDKLEEFNKFLAVITAMAGIVLILLVFLGREKNKQLLKRDLSEFDFSDEKKITVKVCNVCHTENTLNSKSCKKCGSSLSNIVCPICMTVNPYDQKYCSNCETILQNVKRHE